MRKRGRILALLAAGFLVMGAGAAYGAQAGPGDGLIRTEDGRTERVEAPGETEKETERAEETAGESALPAVPEGLPDGDVLSDPAIAGDTDKIIVVRGQGGSAVRTAYYRAEDGAWGQVFETSGVWGLNGCSADKVEGDKKTPTGVYRFNLAFGILDDPGAVLPYHKVTAEDYWVDDPESRYYNRLVDASQVEKDWDSAEHLVDVSPYYNYALSLTYNEEAVPGKGSAIFLHCTAEGYPGSSGCICIPEPEMKLLLQQADERTKIVILEG